MKKGGTEFQSPLLESIINNHIFIYILLCEWSANNDNNRELIQYTYCTILNILQIKCNYTSHYITLTINISTKFMKFFN